MITSCPEWFTNVVDRLPGQGIIHYNTANACIEIAEDPTPCENPLLRTNGAIALSYANQGRHYQKLDDGTVWAINDARTHLLKTTDGFTTVTSYALPAAIVGNDCYMGIDIHVDNPVVWGTAGIYILNIDTGEFYDVTGNLDLSNAVQDPFGFLPKNITTVD